MIAAQRVPPSAWSTSQSSQSVRSPSALKSHDAAQGAADQPLDLDRPPVGTAARDGALRPFPVEAGSSEYSAVIQPCPLPRSQRGIVLLDGRGAEDDRAPLRVEHRAVRLLEEVGLEVELAQLVGPASVVACHRVASSRSLSGGARASRACAVMPPPGRPPAVDVLDLADRAAGGTACPSRGMPPGRPS